MRRTYAERLELRIEAKAILGTQDCWIIGVSAKNIGSSLIHLGSTRICRIVSLSDIPEDLVVDSFDVFTEEETIESGESVQEELFFRADDVSRLGILRLELVVDAGKDSQYRWRANRMVALELYHDNPSEISHNAEDEDRSE